MVLTVFVAAISPVVLDHGDHAQQAPQLLVGGLRTQTAEPTLEPVSVDPTRAPTPDPSPQPTRRPHPTPLATQQPVSRTLELAAVATWYCEPGVSRCTIGYPASCLCAAISPDLAFLRGKIVETCLANEPSRCVSVKVVDCDCSATRGIDLYSVAFRVLAPLSQGRISVVLR